MVVNRALHQPCASSSGVSSLSTSPVEDTTRGLMVNPTLPPPCGQQRKECGPRRHQARWLLASRKGARIGRSCLWGKNKPSHGSRPLLRPRAHARGSKAQAKHRAAPAPTPGPTHPATAPRCRWPPPTPGWFSRG